MPQTPKQIRERKARAEFQIGGEPFWVEYVAAPVEALTQEQVEAWQEKVNAAKTPEEANKIVADWLCEYVTAWDCVESIADDGAPGPMFPLDAERVATELDGAFLARVIIEVVRDANQAKLEGTA